MTEKEYRPKSNPFIKGRPFSPENKRKYVKARQCATVFMKGTRKGTQCKAYAVADSLFCRRHKAPAHGRPMSEATREGQRRFWERMRAIEAESPGFFRQFMQGSGGTAAAYRERIRMQKAKGFDRPHILRPLKDLVGTEDPTLLKAHGKLIRLKGALPVIDKPFEEMKIGRAHV